MMLHLAKPKAKRRAKRLVFLMASHCPIDSIQTSPAQDFHTDRWESQDIANCRNWCLFDRWVHSWSTSSCDLVGLRRHRNFDRYLDKRRWIESGPKLPRVSILP